MKNVLWQVGVVGAIICTTVSAHLQPVLGFFVFYAFQFGLLLPAMFIMSRKFRISSLTKFDYAVLSGIGVFVAAAAFSSISGISFIYSLEQVCITAFMLAFLFLTYKVRWLRKIDIYRDIRLIVIAITTLDLSALIVSLINSSLVFGDYSRFIGWYSNANYVGSVAGVALLAVPALLASNHIERGERRFYSFVVIPTLIASLVLCGSRGAWASVIAGVVILFFTYREALTRHFFISSLSSVAVLITILSVGFLIEASQSGIPSVPSTSATPEPPSSISDLSRQTQRLEESDISAGRLELYQVLFKAWMSDPFTGVGYRATSQVVGMEGFSAHNIYLGVLAETGIIGFLAFGFVLVILTIMGGKSVLAGAVACVLVGEIFESSILGWAGPTALVCWGVIFANAKWGLLNRQLS